MQRTVICGAQISDVQAEKKDASGRRGERQKRHCSETERNSLILGLGEHRDKAAAASRKNFHQNKILSVSALC